MFDNLRKGFHKRLLTKKLRTVSVERRPGDFESALNIGILFDIAPAGSVDLVRDYAENLKKQGKKVEILGYIDDAGRHNDFPFKHFNRKDLDFFFRPTSSLVQQFANTQFDILICLFTEEVLPLEYVAAISRAHIRVGQYSNEKTYCFDLMIDTANSKDMKNLVGQMDYFLKIINKPQYASR